MKPRKKVLRCIIALLFVAGIVSAIRFTSQQKKNDSILHIEPTNQEIQKVQEIQETQIYTIMWPDNWFEEELQAWQLVLRWEYEDHANVIFIDQEIWQNYINPYKMIYWDQISFKWEIEQIDWAAGTHYYNAVSIDTLEELFVVDDETEKESL